MMPSSTMAKPRPMGRPPTANKNRPSKRLRFAPPLTGSPRIQKHVRSLSPVRIKTTVEAQQLCWCPPTRGRVTTTLKYYTYADTAHTEAPLSEMCKEVPGSDNTPENYFDPDKERGRLNK
jgi:hypothetical protein